MDNLHKYGNELTICGLVVGNGETEQTIMFPSTDISVMSTTLVYPTEDELKQIFFQLDVQDITNSQKVVLRKSQRNLDAVISWNVFRRDNYTCVYCGNDHTPLTIDHLVLWEEMGDTVEDNLVTACKKCNHTRGNKSLPDFLKSPYYLGLTNPKATHPDVLLGYLVLAEKLPKRKPRSR